jgi:Fuc2NAc and GlcNAc transferase
MMPLPLTTLALIAAATLVLTAVSTPAFRTVALRWQLVDRPNERSSHTGLVARGGGVPLILAVMLGLAFVRPPQLTTAAITPFAVGLGALAVAALGLWDDCAGLSPLGRLAAHLVIAAVVVWATGGLASLPLPSPMQWALGSWGNVLAIVWIAGVINFYNFLDGIDGLAGIQAVITGAGIALACWDSFAAVLGAAVAGAAAGFLLHNWSPARIFLGDVGSGVLGFLFATAPLMAPPSERGSAVRFVALSLFLFLADATWTLGRRMMRGERWYEAHRQHMYQRLVIAGWSHSQVSAAIGAGSLLLTAVALVAWRSGAADWGWASLVLAVAVFGAELRLAGRSR